MTSEYQARLDQVRRDVEAVTTEGSEPVFDTTGTGIGPYPVREFTSETGTYQIRYVPRDGLLIWTDRDYGQAACPVSEWLCTSCRELHPWREGDRLTRPCPRCGSAMIPTSPAIRALEDARAEIDGLRARLKAIRSLCAEGRPAVAVERIEAVLGSEHEK